MTETLLMIGTRKGLWLARSDAQRRTWTLDGPHLSGETVTSCAIDVRGATPRLLAGGLSWFYGPFLVRSDDLGGSWQDPEHAPLAFPEGEGAAVANVWQIVPDGDDRPGVVWAGTEPSALWRSEDGGESFELVRGLWDHPHRPLWEPGFGGQALHTILPHPLDEQRITVGMSTGGVYRSQDGGNSWAPSNTGITGEYLPDPPPEYAHCIHRIARDPVVAERLVTQHHGGVYRSDDDGASWRQIDAGLPSDFGFPVVTHPRESDTAYVFPLEGMGRTPPGGRCAVWRTRDGGGTWEACTQGLPDGGFHVSVLRDAMCADTADPAGIYLGTRDGCVFASADEGDAWTEVARHLPDVLSVRAAVIG
jgi:photosystem II stability/assembly factor-like uncharacterized protein